MSSKHSLTSRLIAGFAFATLSQATVAEAQPYGPGTGNGGMMDGGWGMGGGMGGFGGISALLIALVVLGIAVLVFRRRNT